MIEKVILFVTINRNNSSQIKEKTININNETNIFIFHKD